MEIGKISSAHNTLIKRFKNFKRRKTPELMCLDGVHLHQEYLKAALETPLHTIVSTSFKASNELAQFNELAITEIPDDLMTKISPTKNPVGLLSLASVLTLRAPQTPKLTVILENLQDPGNLGTILRTSLALGVEEVLLSDNCVDVWSAKCLRAGMGAQFFLPIKKLDNLAHWRKNFPGKIIGTALSGTALTDSPLPHPVAFVFGNEGQGLTDNTLKNCHQLLKIPMQANSESLNVASAHAIICYEWMKQHPNSN